MACWRRLGFAGEQRTIERGRARLSEIETGCQQCWRSKVRVNSGRHSEGHHGRPKPPHTAAEPGLGHANFGLCRPRVTNPRCQKPARLMPPAVRARFQQLGTAPVTTSSSNGEGPKSGLGWVASGLRAAAKRDEIRVLKHPNSAPKSAPLAWSPGGCSSPPKLVLISQTF